MKTSQKIPFFIFLFSSIGFHFISFSGISQDNFKTENQIFDTLIQTVKIHPLGDSPKTQTLSEIAPLQFQNLVLTFDKLTDYAEDYAVKIYNCNADWRRSDLAENEYLEDYNEFYILDNEPSFNTKINFVHYQFRLPKVKIAGNYIVKVYEDGDEEAVILVRRFCIYQPLFGTGGKSERVTGGNISVRNQEIQFVVNYANVDLLNPEEQVKVTIRQNGRWNKTVTNLKPTFIKTAQKRLEYNFFNTENIFRGGNEFRLFDLTSLQQNTLNIAKIERTALRNTAILMPAKSRQGKVRHDIFDDMNGRFYIQNRDVGQNPTTDSDYVKVFFTLYHPEVAGRVLILGELTNWQLSPRYELVFNPLFERYEGTFLFKQGYYNYMYVLTSNDYHTTDEEYFEGSHFNTENDYEIFVYYRPLGARTDILAGYHQIR